MLYLFDENQPPALVLAIRHLHQRDWPEDRVQSVQDRGWEGTDDSVWIDVLAGLEVPWTVVTRDMMDKEWYQVLGSSGTWFVLNKGWRTMQYWDLAWKFGESLAQYGGSRSPEPGGRFCGFSEWEGHPTALITRGVWALWHRFGLVDGNALGYGPDARQAVDVVLPRLPPVGGNVGIVGLTSVHVR